MKSEVLWKKYWRAFLYAAFAAVILYVMFQTPYCHDEWKWGSPERVELMRRGFAGYNGRYLGNMLALAITRSVAAKALIMAGTVVWILYALESNLRRAPGRTALGQQRLLLLCAMLLLLALPRTLYAQSYGWPAAFVNFVPPALLLLLWFNWTEPLYRMEEDPACTAVQTALAFPLALATQLFSEHTTLFALLYAAWVLAFSAVRRKKICAAHAAYFAGALLGAAIMFSNTAYRHAASSQAGYKKITLSLSSMYHQFADRILDPLFLDNWLLNALLAASILLLIVRSRRRTAAGTLLTLVLCGYSLYGVWHRIYPAWVFAGNGNLNRLIEIGISFLFFLSVLAGVRMYAGPGTRLSVCVLYVSAAAAAAPLVAANPIGPRCFYVSYLFQCLALLKLLQELTREQDAELYYPIWAVGTAAAVLCVIYVRMFSAIGAADADRAERIRAAAEQGAESVTLPVLPYSDYVWTTVPQTEEWERYFREFYGIPPEMELQFQ